MQSGVFAWSFLFAAEDPSVSIDLFMAQRDDDEFRHVIDSNGNDGISKTPAYNHICTCLMVDSFRIFREETLIRCNQATCQGYSHLTAMRMAVK